MIEVTQLGEHYPFFFTQDKSVGCLLCQTEPVKRFIYFTLNLVSDSFSRIKTFYYLYICHTKKRGGEEI